MNYTTVNGKTMVQIEDGEDRQTVLRAIARASYDLALPAGTGFLHFTPGGALSDKECDALIRADGLSMDYVHGRQCKTFLKADNSGVLVLNNYLFERDRGSPDAVLTSAIEKLTTA